MREIIQRINDQVWGIPLLIALLGTGLYLNIKLRFLPIRRLGYALRLLFGGREKGTNKNGEVSSIQALTTELAATIGTGNIVGVATAMILGGPGALVWMMVSSILGMATKLVESTLSVKYRGKNEAGETVGGPMYTMDKAIKPKTFGKVLSILFSILAVLCSFGMGNMTQSNSVALALHNAFQIPVAKTGLIMTIITILVVLGGIKRIAKLTELLVPIMGCFYLAGAMVVILTNCGRLVEGVFRMIQMALCPGAISGGIFGTLTVSVAQSIRYGVSRGVFSNEAGLGAAGISAASAHTDDYIKQGYISMTGVFLDTIVICAITGLALATSGKVGCLDTNGNFLTGIDLTIAAFETTFGRYGGYFISICISLFAFATIIGWAYQGEKAFEFLVKKQKYCVFYRLTYALVVFIGAVVALEVVWGFSDICNGLMAVPNLICVLYLSKGICKELWEEATGDSKILDSRIQLYLDERK